jgi:hypothetical protein
LFVLLLKTMAQERPRKEQGCILAPVGGVTVALVQAMPGPRGIIVPFEGARDGARGIDNTYLRPSPIPDPNKKRGF